MAAPVESHFVNRGLRISYCDYGAGPRALVLIHGLLMDRRMFGKVAPALADRGYRVITVDLPGHGTSDQPYDMTQYSTTQYARDIIALLDHLHLEEAVIGGTSLGANVALEVTVATPERVRALVLEMPVLENGITAAALLFVPLAAAIRLNQRAMRFLSAFTRRIPRSFFVADIVLDFARRDPGSSLAVLDGVTFGRVAPHVDERRLIQQSTLVIGHRSDPIHPFSDSDRTAHELPRARLVRASSILEWRMRPGRLNCELAAFLGDAWRDPQRWPRAV